VRARAELADDTTSPDVRALLATAVRAIDPAVSSPEVVDAFYAAMYK
jgi:hypothetical protein